jgi:hypothetical protein
MGYCVEKLAPEAIDENTRRIVCGLLVNGIEFRSREEPNIAKIMGYVYKDNTVQTLQEIASREDSGLYVARRGQVALAEGQVALAATIISLQERDGAPRYNDPDKPDNLMYMGHFGVATNDDAWKRHFMGIIKQARSDFGNKKVTGLGAYVSVGDDNELPRAVRNLSPDTYRVFGGEAGVYGTVDGAPGHYRLHTVEFTKSIGRAGLTGLARKLLEGRLSHRDTRLNPGRYAPAAPGREEIPVAT